MLVVLPKFTYTSTKISDNFVPTVCFTLINLSLRYFLLLFLKILHLHVLHCSNSHHSFGLDSVDIAIKPDFFGLIIFVHL
jgi:hypothetical protein